MSIDNPLGIITAAGQDVWNLIDPQQSQSSGQFNADGSGKANDYHQPPLPASTFPTLNVAGGKEVLVHRDRLRQVAAQMRKDLDLLGQQLQSLAAEWHGAAGLGGWPTADALAANLQGAYDAVAQFYGRYNVAYEMVVAAIQANESGYAQAETATASAARTVGPAAGAPGWLAPGA